MLRTAGMCSSGVSYQTTSTSTTTPMATAVLYTATGYRDLLDPITLRLHNLCRVSCGLHNQAPMVAAVLS
ncbi:hypothetical protein PC129_g20758 [Phytophthora cactorum]|uniref:Uncharacterized protein n=1 Tax=Phytophthora cactorum TaxID=29920 RepID=A0A8T1B0J6_9STRA|nr:hypothetical protein PC114_g23803 [Phytophthora cactorum]KAG2893980.1 hypothetical protein PC117_g23625 [Phytophthora cactorum]KAG2971662.1 hypothetical protein PC119_g23320 [Phytophthora cactorum]KAG2992620.1 hypothetical protein PC120_g22441 [Phytophthora cactorum]KAG3129583.1 hypothetical protein C6341_g24079 [Phytophthora cactorum]